METLSGGGENKHPSGCSCSWRDSQENSKNQCGNGEETLWSCCSSQRRNYGNLLYPGDKMMAPVQIKAEDGMEGGWQGGVGLQPGMGPRVSLEGTD